MHKSFQDQALWGLSATIGRNLLALQQWVHILAAVVLCCHCIALQLHAVRARYACQFASNEDDFWSSQGTGKGHTVTLTASQGSRCVIHCTVKKCSLLIVFILTT